MAMLFITHDLGIVRKLADDVVRDAARQDRRGGAGRRDLRQSRSIPIRRALLAAEPKGEPPPADPSRAACRRRADDLKVWFPIKRGFLRRTVGHVKAVDGVSLVAARGADARRRRRIRLGQDDARPRDAAAHPLGGADRLSAASASTAERSKEMRPLRRDMQIVFQDPYGSLSPRLSVAEIVEEGLHRRKSRT